MSDRKLAFLYSPEIEGLSYPPDCPFKTQRASLTRQRLKSFGLLGTDGCNEVAPRKASLAELKKFHTARYLKELRRAAGGDLTVEGLHMGLGGPDTPENGQLEGVAGLVTYGHVFGNLALGAIAVANPHVTIIPDHANDGSAITLGGPELIIGMNVLKTLHIYFAFPEGKMYVSQAFAS